MKRVRDNTGYALWTAGLIAGLPLFAWQAARMRRDTPRLEEAPGPREGRIDGYCVGAPWGMAAEAEGLGQRLLATHTIRPGCAEKVLGVTRSWATLHPAAHLSLVAALIEAGRWLEQPGHRADAAQMLIDARLIAAPAETLRAALSDDGADLRGPQFIFGGGQTLSPHHDDARWFLLQMQRWAQTRSVLDVDSTVQSSYRLRLHGQASVLATSVSSVAH